MLSQDVRHGSTLDQSYQSCIHNRSLDCRPCRSVRNIFFKRCWILKWSIDSTGCNEAKFKRTETKTLLHHTASYSYRTSLFSCLQYRTPARTHELGLYIWVSGSASTFNQCQYYTFSTVHFLRPFYTLSSRHICSVILLALYIHRHSFLVASSNSLVALYTNKPHTLICVFYFLGKPVVARHCSRQSDST